MAAMLHTSVLAPHLLPRMTSGERYCRVWMSFVKWCPTQQALPRSAILTEIFSKEMSGVCSADLGLGVLDLSRLMSETSLVRRSLGKSVRQHMIGAAGYVRGLFALLLDVVVTGGGLEAQTLGHGLRGGLRGGA
jgi:hypothetical protein